MTRQYVHYLCIITQLFLNVNRKIEMPLIFLLIQQQSSYYGRFRKLFFGVIKTAKYPR